MLLSDVGGRIEALKDTPELIRQIFSDGHQLRSLASSYKILHNYFSYHVVTTTF